MPKINQEQINQGLETVLKDNPELLDNVAEKAAKEAAKPAPWKELKSELADHLGDKAQAESCIASMKEGDAAFKELNRQEQKEQMRSFLRDKTNTQAFEREKLGNKWYMGDRKRNLARMKSGQEPTTDGEKILGAYMNTYFSSGSQDILPRTKSKLERRGYDKAADKVQKTMEAGDFGAGGAVVPLEVAEEIIAFNFAANVIEDFNITRWPLDSGSFDIPKFTSKVDVNWEGESSSASTTEAGTGNRSLEAKKLTALVPLSNDLLQRAIDGFEEQLMRHIRKETQLTRQLAFLRGDGVNKPLGLLNSVDQANNRFERLGGSGSAASAEDILQTFVKAKNEVDNGNIDTTEAGWIMHERTVNGVIAQDVQDGIYPKVMMSIMNNGTLLGKPVKTTNQIPTNKDASGEGDSDETEIYFCAWDQFHVGDTMDVRVEVFDGAAYPESGSIQSAVAKDEKVARVVQKTDSALGDPQAASVVEAVDFGADAFS